MRLINQNVLARVVKEENKTKGGIILTGAGNENYIKAEVVNFAKEIPELVIGDKIYLHPSTRFTPVDVEAEELIIFDAANILSID